MKRIIHLLSILTVIAGGLFAPRASAQFGIDWLTIDGGGGLASGGNFSLNGTLGQPDAGTMSGGAFTLNGGFWSGAIDDTLGSLPTLSIRIGIGNTVILSWPHPSTGFQLQETSAISAGGTGWANVGPVPSVVGANKELSLTIGPGSRGFRLCRP